MNHFTSGLFKTRALKSPIHNYKFNIRSYSKYVVMNEWNQEIKTIHDPYVPPLTANLFQ